MKKDLSYSTFITTLENMTMSSSYDDIINTIIGYMRDAAELARIKGLVEYKKVYTDYEQLLNELANNAHNVLEKHGVYDDVK